MIASKKALTASFVKDNAVPSPLLHQALEHHSVGSISAFWSAFLSHYLAWEGLSLRGHARGSKNLSRTLSLEKCSPPASLWGTPCRPFHDQWFQRATLWSHHQGLLPALPLASFWIVGKSSNLGASVSPSVKMGIIRNRPHGTVVRIYLNQLGAGPAA